MLNSLHFITYLSLYNLQMCLYIYMHNSNEFVFVSLEQVPANPNNCQPLCVCVGGGGEAGLLSGILSQI